MKTFARNLVVDHFKAPVAKTEADPGWPGQIHLIDRGHPGSTVRLQSDDPADFEGITHGAPFALTLTPQSAPGTAVPPAPAPTETGQPQGMGAQDHP